MTMPKRVEGISGTRNTSEEIPSQVRADKTKSSCVLLTKDNYRALHDDYIRRELQVAFEQVDHGEISDLDMRALLAEAQRRHAARQQLRVECKGAAVHRFSGRKRFRHLLVVSPAIMKTPSPR
jgi:hypothetical protein